MSEKPKTEETGATARIGYRALFGDVPLRKAMVAWNSVWDDHAGEPCKVVVIPWPDKDRWCNHLGLANTVGACSADPKWSDTETMLNLMVEVWHIACRDRVPLENIHNALMVIPEYRETLSGETFFPPLR